MALNNSFNGLIKNIVNRGDLSGKNGETVLINAVPGNNIQRISLVGLGENKPLSAKNYKKALLAAVNSLKKPKIESLVCCLAESEVIDRDWQWKSRHIIETFNDAVYQFTELKSEVWSYITANEGFLKRVLDYQSFMVTATLAAPFVRGVDVVVGTSPQFFTVCAAYVVSRLKRIPFVFELRDMWPESIKAVGAMKESAAIRALERLELFLYRKAARIVSVTHSFKKALIGRGVAGNKIEVVTNGVDMSRFRAMPKDAALVQELSLSQASLWRAMLVRTAWRTIWRLCLMQPRCCEQRTMATGFISSFWATARASRL